jgi:hypothetical protein
MQRTALRAHKIVAFLKVRIGSTPVPIHWCAAADAQAVGRAGEERGYQKRLDCASSRMPRV